MSQAESTSKSAVAPQADATKQFNNTADANASAGTDANADTGEFCVKEDKIEMKGTKGKDPHALDIQSLEKASSIPVFSESGESVEFGTLFKDQKTIVVFIRMFCSRIFPFSRVHILLTNF